MKIYIPSSGRADSQRTYKFLPKRLKSEVIFIVPKKEVKTYQDTFVDYSLKETKAPPLIVGHPESVKGIGPVRNWILTKYHDSISWGDKLVMLDDDLRFDTRRVDEPSKFLVATEKEILELFKAIETALNKYAHVGVAPREGGNRIYEDNECTRMLRVLAYDVVVFRKEKIKFDRVPLQEDFDVTLQLLRKGYKNLLLARWVNGQGVSNAPGGCSQYRNLEMQKKAAEKLSELHHPFVKLVSKLTKSSWTTLGAGSPVTRTDVVISWKKAYMESQNAR